jgi:hypothetical protein
MSEHTCIMSSALFCVPVARFDPGLETASLAEVYDARDHSWDLSTRVTLASLRLTRYHTQ